MPQLLKENQIVRSSTGQLCRVLNYLGGGGQGEVYRAQWAGGEFALKWYFRQSATGEQRAALEELVKQGSPSNEFLWPEDIAESRDVQGFGYIMKLRSPRYRSLTDLVAGKISPSYMALIAAGINLSKAFRSLHTRGLCYRDISFGNAFFDPDTGEVLVCDNDNVTTNRSRVGGVLGTPDFMAPELVRKEAYPSNKSDLYSLAVLLFYLFHMSHPLQGKKVLRIRCWDGAAREQLFGKDPLFIFDPTDDSNAAVNDPVNDPQGEAGKWAIVYWNIYPTGFRNTFAKSFTSGLGDPDARVTELEWLMSLSNLRDSLFRCSCGTPNFYDIEAIHSTPASSPKCWNCGHDLKWPFHIKIGRSIIMLNDGSKLFPHHIALGSDFDFSAPVAEVVRHPTEPNIWGLKNLTRNNWVATKPDGAVRDVEYGRSVPLTARTKISFGKTEGEVRY